MTEREYAFAEWLRLVFKSTGKDSIDNGLELLKYLAEDLNAVQKDIEANKALAVPPLSS